MALLYLDNHTLSVLPHDYLRPSDNEVEEATITFTHKQSFEAGLTTLAALMYRLTGDEDILIATDLPSGTSIVVRVAVLPEDSFAELEAKVTAEYKKAHKYEKGVLRTGYFHHTQPLTGDLAVFHEGVIAYNALLYKELRMAIFREQFGQFGGCDKITLPTLVTPSQTLPDPSQDLDWDGYRGAIQDIFLANAAKFPNRECVVETGGQRVFSYRQIDEASNVVGNFLKATGVRKGDVVMTYAHRGVDLVVAVMGTLKAGATFSVIDPAYPPARQNVYLSVARPRALIVLAEAGQLDEAVELYIASELEVVTRLPQLRITGDGSLAAGVDLAEYSSGPVGVRVGPDSNPTLSFTLGSEGTPKGVLGRHYSLAYYFPWMAQRFGLSETDRFTMLSGIAHDPIQRDMFTPLFLGARLLVPTAEDIGTPGALALWMAQHGATVTHLTPAMGQLLSAQAQTPIPLLHHAFFVGDVLTKRDCLRLQTLAEHVRIVNMYGTTETLRAVLYYEVPSRRDDARFLQRCKDVVPAGSGMLNVQLVVVNRHRQQCGVGEVGEIYVRAAGLAEGYRGLPELNKEKFVENWMAGSLPARVAKDDYLGARDRLYRTGDLGRYLPEGDVECCGRADDQVKIRGFRIELGEIDTHLLRHPLVRENVTLVRKGADPTLVAYVVPKDDDLAVAAQHEDPLVERMARYTPLTRDIAAYLKLRLAAYAVPSLIVPLAKMPLNPNGKVDKPRLPYPTPEQMEAYTQLTGPKETLSATEKLVQGVWSAVLGRVAALDDSFFDLGGHLILATRMIFEVRRQLGADVPLGAIYKSPTLKEFAQVVDAKEARSDAAYAADARQLERTLAPTYASKHDAAVETVFLTGGTGFLGLFILRNLLHKGLTVYAHVRAASAAAGLERLRRAGAAFGVWDPRWEPRIEVVLGDLAKPRFGSALWDTLVDKVDAVIHNGALVHWVYPYEQLRDANVVATVNTMALAAAGRPKFYSFVSSTSTLDTEHFFQGGVVLESDDLSGSATGLGNGYGQSKWAAEHLVRAAGRRGLRGCITRPGYVTGFSRTGASNTDDFLVRMLKGCLELGAYPAIANSVNMVPVDHVARVVVATALFPPESMAVAHVTGHPRIAFASFLGSLARFYSVAQCLYGEWRARLEQRVLSGRDLALFPLLHFVLGDLPRDTQAPELDDANAVALLLRDKNAEETVAGVDAAQMEVYLAYLAKIGYLPAPTKGKLPEVAVTAEQLSLVQAGAGGRQLAN